MLVMQNYADISTKNSNRGLFSENNHRFRKASIVCGIPT